MFLRIPIHASRRRMTVVISSLVAGAFFVVAPSRSVGAEPSAISNIDSALQHLMVQRSPSTSAAVEANTTAMIPGHPLGLHLGGGPRFDSQGRVMIHIHLDGSQSMEAVEAALGAFGATEVDKNASYRKGIIAAYAPIDTLDKLAKLAGIRALTMEHRPELRVGAVTSEGT